MPPDSTFCDRGKPYRLMAVEAFGLRQGADQDVVRTKVSVEVRDCIAVGPADDNRGRYVVTYRRPFVAPSPLGSTTRIDCWRRARSAGVREAGRFIGWFFRLARYPDRTANPTTIRPSKMTFNVIATPRCTFEPRTWRVSTCWRERSVVDSGSPPLLNPTAQVEPEVKQRIQGATCLVDDHQLGV